MLLAGDIGATKTNLAIFSHERGARRPLAEATFRSAEYPCLESAAREFLRGVDISVDRACIGVAGPVVGGRATGTNLPSWTIDEVELVKELGLSWARLLNDLEVIAYAVPILGGDDIYTLNAGRSTPNGTIAVIAPGTGLGEGFLTWEGSRYQAHPSEGGHTDFGPNSCLELGLLRYLQKRFGHVSYERVCSGMGISNIYAYLKAAAYADEPLWLTEKLDRVEDKTPVIVSVAIDSTRECELCSTTLDLFISIFGAEAGNLALKLMATGGIYLGGGIPPRILPALQQGTFICAFANKGRLSHVVENIPVHVILNSKAALWGAAYYGLGR